MSSGPVYLAGPTASGKSAVALLLAEQLGGEIITVDSMQVYRGMEIGTAKPPPGDRARVPHHLIDVAELTESFDVARFLQLARHAEGEVLSRGRIPIFCGGTGMYFNALAGGIGCAPAPDRALRSELEATPLPELLRELQQKDPGTFAEIDRSNPRRVVRALEVIRLSGKALASQRSDWGGVAPGLWIGLRRDRADLNARIDARVEEMFSAGLLQETRQLIAAGLETNRTAMQAIGYRQVVEHLRGERDLHATIELVKQKTRQYAKRQMTWFRHQLDLRWIDVAATDSPDQTARGIILLRQSERSRSDLQG